MLQFHGSQLLFFFFPADRSEAYVTDGIERPIFIASVWKLLSHGESRQPKSNPPPASVICPTQSGYFSRFFHRISGAATPRPAPGPRRPLDPLRVGLSHGRLRERTVPAGRPAEPCRRQRKIRRKAFARPAPRNLPPPQRLRHPPHRRLTRNPPPQRSPHSRRRPPALRRRH